MASSFWIGTGLTLMGACFSSSIACGKALRKRRYAFSESFAAIAYALHAKATQNAASADRSMALLKHFMHWHLDPTSAFESKGTGVRPTVALGPYMIALVTAQELRDALGNEGVFQPDRGSDDRIHSQTFRSP